MLLALCLTLSSDELVSGNSHSVIPKFLAISTALQFCNTVSFVIVLPTPQSCEIFFN